MTRPGNEPRSPGRLANTLTESDIYIYIYIYIVRLEGNSNLVKLSL